MTALAEYIQAKPLAPRCPQRRRRRREGARRPLAPSRLVRPAPPASSAAQLMPEHPANVTQLLRAVGGGDRRDLDALMAAIYDDLRRLAVNHMQNERGDHTLQPTALVHEAYLKLIDQRSTNWNDRIHFFAIASRIIRRILVDHTRERQAEKRGGGRQRVPLEQADELTGAAGIDLVALDEALAELAELDPVQAQIVEMRFFSGLTLEEVAQALSMGRRSVDRDWHCARTWLYCRLSGAPPGGSHG